MRSPAEAPSLLYLPELPAAGREAALSEDESHYVTRVCRLGEGAVLRATDGEGRIARIEVLAGGPRVRARVLDVETIARGGEAWLLCGAPEGRRADWLVEKLGELGVARFLPVQALRAEWRGVRLDRWRKLAVAAMRQSRRAHGLDLLEPMSLARALELLPDRGERWIAAQDGEPASATSPEDPSIGAVGPAEGWSDAERTAFARAGFRPVRLAGARLRTETAGLAWAAWWAARAAVRFAPDRLDGP